jgi:hypothetical protein
MLKMTRESEPVGSVDVTSEAVPSAFKRKNEKVSGNDASSATPAVASKLKVREFPRVMFCKYSLKKLVSERVTALGMTPDTLPLEELLPNDPSDVKPETVTLLVGVPPSMKSKARFAATPLSDEVSITI